MAQSAAETPPSAAPGGEGTHGGSSATSGYLSQGEIRERLSARARGFIHDNTIEPLAPRPDEPVYVFATSGTALPLRHAAVFYTTDGSPPAAQSARVPLEPADVLWEPLAGYVTRWCAELPGQPAGTIVRYRLGGWRAGMPAREDGEPDLWAHDSESFWFRYPDARGITTFSYRPAEAETGPAWIRDAVLYQIVLDRFHPGTPDGVFARSGTCQEHHGGTLRGLRAALPYLERLGVTCLWLSPITCAEAYHRYDVIDYYALDPTLGTISDLQDLVDDAHRRGIRVILDYVPSHCSWHHAAFVAAQRDQTAGTAPWFAFESWPHGYRHFMGVELSLPALNADDPGARAHIIGSAVRWLNAAHVDGFRLDHASGTSIDFLLAVQVAAHATVPNCFTLGEVTDTPDVLRRFRGRLDAVLDFPLADALRCTFGSGQWDLGKFEAFLSAHEHYLLDGPGRVSFLDNHDLNRFLFLAGGRTDRLKLAALCQFTLSPTPTIYYGTEIGLSQERDAAGYGGDAEARRDMLWDAECWDKDLLKYYRGLIRLRRTNVCLCGGERRVVHVDPATATYAYVRSAGHASRARYDEILVAFNLSTETRTITVPAPPAGTTYRCLVNTGGLPEMHTAADAAQAVLPAGTGAAWGMEAG